MSDELRYSCMSKDHRSHLVEWTDGVTALVTGTWVEALSVAQGRAQHHEVERLARALREDAATLATAATLADRAASQAICAASACLIAADSSTQAPGPSTTSGTP